MDVESIRVYAAAHIAFFLLTILLLADFCEKAPTLMPNYEFGVAGMEYISEKLMVCQHSPTWWQTLPHIIGSVLSVIVLQLYAVFEALQPPPSPTTGDVIFMAVSVAVVAGWGALSAFDHRRSSMLLPGQDELHIVSVVVFLGAFCTLHAMISHRYYIKSPFSMRFARLRRASYFAVEGVHIVMCVLFSVFAMLSNVFHAILIEYIVATLFCSLNVLSFVILLRVRDHAVSQELDRAWT